MANSLSEGFIRVTYVNIGGIHHQTIPVNYDGTPSPGVMPNVTLKNTTTLAADAALDDWLDVFQGVFSSSTIFGLSEAYAVDADDEEAHYLFAWDANHVGAATESDLPFNGLCQTFRTKIGGILRVTAMSCVIVSEIKNFPPYEALTAGRAISDYIVGATSMFIGRDNNYAVAPISSTSKVYDVLRKRGGF